MWVSMLHVCGHIYLYRCKYTCEPKVNDECFSYLSVIYTNHHDQSSLWKKVFKQADGLMGLESMIAKWSHGCRNNWELTSWSTSKKHRGGEGEEEETLGMTHYFVESQNLPPVIFPPRKLHLLILPKCSTNCANMWIYGVHFHPDNHNSLPGP